MLSRVLFRGGAAAQLSAKRGFRNPARSRLPIPELKDTCARFLDTVDPLLTAEERARAKEVVGEFQQGPGKDLQKLLVEYERTQHYLPDHRHYRGSYVEAFWDDMYLVPRDPIVVNSNPFLAFRDGDASRATQTRRAAHLIFNSTTFMELIDDRQLDVSPECPSQYTQIFRTFREPRLARDAIITPQRTRHVTVVHKGRFYSLDVVGSDGLPYSEPRILRALDELVANAANLPAPEFDLSTLTTLNRDEWARIYAALRDHSPDNASALDSINTSLFHVVLEDRLPKDQAELCSLLLHGKGRGRWHDKSTSAVVFPDGQAGFSFEHSWGDGQTTLRWANDVMRRAGESHAQYIPIPGDVNKVLTAREVTVTLPQQLQAAPEHALKAVSPLIKSVDCDPLLYTSYGKELAKAHSLSPDALVQVAFQRAYYQLSGGVVGSTYESCSTKHFLHGRTETIRSVTPESVAFSKVAVGDGDAKQTLRAAVERHVARAKLAQQGFGVDRHLFALQQLALRRGIPLPALYADASYRKLKYDHLSTSNCGSSHMKWFGYGPTTPDCFGLGYMINEDSVSVTITSFKGQAGDMKQAITQSFNDIKKILG